MPHPNAWGIFFVINFWFCMAYKRGKWNFYCSPDTFWLSSTRVPTHSNDLFLVLFLGDRHYLWQFDTSHSNSFYLFASFDSPPPSLSCLQHQLNRSLFNHKKRSPKNGIHLKARQRLFLFRKVRLSPVKMTTAQRIKDHPYMYNNHLFTCLSCDR